MTIKSTYYEDVNNVNPIPKLLSKTKLMRGYRCTKSLYLTIHQPGLEAPISAELQALFDQGNIVGAKAREYYPGGVLVDNKPWDFTGALSRTRELIAACTPNIYEAAFEYMGCYARADIIQYSPETQRFRLFEVKSTTKVKPEHLDDVGLQAWIMAKSGLPIESIHIVHLNPDCRYPDLSNLFNAVDVTQEIRDRYLTVQPKIRELLMMMRDPNIPNIDIGPYCQSPNACGFVEHCFGEKKLPDISIFDLPGMRDRKWELYQEGIIALDDPRLDELNPQQARIIECYKTGERYIDKAGIAAAMANWQYPYVYLDFETINPAIPRYDGTRPFGQTPFQYSVHVCAHEGAELTHDAYLHTDASDPRDALIPRLLEACGTEGSIIAYFSRFESERIQEMAEYSPANAKALLALVDRMVDPLPIFRECVYDNAFAGSFSLKSVAPALLGASSSYDGMAVGNGGEAQRAFEELISPNTSAQKKQFLETAMLEYCKKDTLEMVMLVKWLQNNCQ